MTTPDFQLAFLNKIQRLFAEGDFSASYKYALIIAIADIAVETGHDDGKSLTITHQSLAEKFIDLYWQQSVPFRNDVVLVQNNGIQASIISEIIRFRYSNQLATVISARSASSYELLLKKVTKTVVEKPIFHIQNLGGKKEQFLFESGVDNISLLPGVSYCLRRFQELIQQLARSHWIDHIKRNKKNIGALGQDDDLEAFLFETSRQSLEIVNRGLRRLSNRCFYCHGALQQADVDHFIPHSLYPRDLAHNFVLAHPACNRSKSNTLAAKQHLNNWLEFVQANKDNLAQIGFDAGILGDFVSTNSVTRWGYTNAIAGGAQGWIRPKVYEPIDESYLGLWSPGDTV